MTGVRTMLAWCPDWPVLAACREHDADPEVAVAVVDKQRVTACSPLARVEGVRRGMRVREAQARCTGLVVLPYEPSVGSRLFEPVVAGVEASMAGVQPVRPGVLAMRARGPARYYGGELAAARLLVGRLAELGVDGARVGIADGPFAAEQAARRAEPVLIVPEGGSARFLAPLPVEALGDGDLAALLRKLGVTDLACFASLSPDAVRDRFGAAGAMAHVLAAGADPRGVAARTPPREVVAQVDFEPALDRVDQVAFGIRAAADALVDELFEHHLACTELRVIASSADEIVERTWLHPRWFSGADMVDRVRWQLQGDSTGSGLKSGVTRIRLEPEVVDAIGHHEAGLWGNGPDEGVHHGLSRVQGMLGHEAVVTPVLGGGRRLAERQVFVPWGDRASTELSDRHARPWPGSLPEPPPATVFPEPRAVVVVAEDGTVVTVDERGTLSAPPAAFSITGRRQDARRVTGWAGPWPAAERWWDAAAARLAYRFQLVDAAGDAWLLVLADGAWVAEARYD